MGCDIHICIQAQESDGSWHVIPTQRVYDFAGAPRAVEGVPIEPMIFQGRNYDLFGILADVRNGSGFAGVTTGLGWSSIAPNRGWPTGFREDDVPPSPQYPEGGPRFMGDHSFTHVSLEELKTFSWDTISTTLFGVISAEEYEKLPQGQAPNGWSGGISGPGIVVYDVPSYLEAKRMGRLTPRPYVRVSWNWTARQATGDWSGKVIPWLEELAAGRPLRLVIGFDN